MRRSFLAAAALSLACACGKPDQITVRRVPKEQLVQPPMGMAMGGAPAPEDAPDGSSAPGVHWIAPKGWKEGPGGAMQVAVLAPPAAHGRAQASISVFPGDVGGELANVNRWRGQVGLAALSDADLPGARHELSCALGRVLVYDFTGSDDQGPARVVAAMLSVGGRTWFFKLDGDPAAVAADKPAFTRMLEGLTSDAS